MIDIKYLREHPDDVKLAVRNKNASVSSSDIDKVLVLDERRRELLGKLEAVRRARNELSESMGKSKPDERQIVTGKKLREEASALEKDFEEIDAAFLALFKQIPNIPYPDVPVGKSEDENVIAKTVGEIPKLAFEAKNHWQLAEPLGLIDKERAAKVAGSRFAYIRGNLVRLEFALIQFVLATLTDEKVLAEIIKKNELDVSNRAFIPILPPLMIRTDMYDAMDRLEPRDDRYKLEGEDLWLQGSAEHVLGSMHAGETFTQEQLPLRYVGFATSFRREAGTYGKDMEGIFRMHQFDKLEMESFSLPAKGFDEHLFMIAVQEYFMQKLEIPYHVLMKCTADIGKPNARGVDIEAWLPGQGKYRETHTADYMTDYQSRRLKVKVRLDSGESVLVHTNDATALALGRTMIAIIENYQQADGSVGVPKVLQPYYGGETL